jgi:shikimate kinase
MRILLVGVSCVGKSTIGKLIAEKLGYKFFDFDFEVEKGMGEHISSIKKRTLAFINEHSYREEVKHILRDILRDNKEDIIIAMPPSGLFGSYNAIIKKHPDVLTIALHDEAKNIVERLTFFDDESKPIYNVVNENNKHLYYQDLKKDISYFGRTYKKAKMQFNLNGMNANDSAEALFQHIVQYTGKDDLIHK